MLKYMKLRNKILISIGLLVLVVATLMIAMIIGRVDNVLKDNVQALSAVLARHYASEIAATLEKGTAAAGYMARLADVATEAGEMDAAEASVLLKGVLRANPGILAAWTFQTFRDDKGPRSLRYFRHRFTGKISDGDMAAFPGIEELCIDFLNQPRLQSLLSEPREIQAAGRTFRYLFYLKRMRDSRSSDGVAGVMIDLDVLTSFFSRTAPFDGGYALAVSNSGVIVGHPVDGYIGQSITRHLPPADREAALLAIKNGKQHLIRTSTDDRGQDEAYLLFVPFKINAEAPYWGFGIHIPLSKMMTDSRDILWWAASIGTIGILVLILVIFSLSRHIVKPLYHLVNVSQELAQGRFDRRANLDSLDEFGLAAGYIDKAFDIVVDKMFWYESMLDAIPFPLMVADLDMRCTFINRAAEKRLEIRRGAIAEKHFSTSDMGMFFVEDAVAALRKNQSTIHQSLEDAYFQIDSTWLHNIRGQRVGHVEIVQDLTEANLLKKKAEDRNWLRTGEAGLSDVMRGDMGVRKLGKRILIYLCTYLNAHVGAFFLLDPEKGGFLDLVASYALKQRAPDATRFRLGEGLVGQAALEKKPILVESAGEEGISIETASGVFTPHHLFILPLLFEDQVQGVIEIGCLRALTGLEQTLLERAARYIGITVNTVLSRTRMKKLLEQTQIQAQELRVQQEELRRANEDLEAQTHALKTSEVNLQSQQEELRVTNEELEERTHALEIQRDEIRKKNLALEKAQDEIQQKAKDLEIANRYKAQFLANMSHELRTPLNSILILSQLLYQNKERKLTEKQVEFARTIYSSGSDLLSLINEILDLSKVEAGKPDIIIEEMHIEELLTDMRRTFGPMAEQSKLSFTIDLSEEVPPYLYTDGKRIWQIMKNLLSNAFKFTESGGVTVRIYPPGPEEAAQHLSDSSDAVAFSVTDTGIGIPEDKQALIFMAFQQADGTTSRKYGGTGLGLSISREFAQFLGGCIVLKSHPGQGSTFTLYLPRKSQEPPLEESDRAASRKNANETPLIKDDRRTFQAGEKSLLIIDDDPDFSKLLLELARKKGFKGLIAEDGETGLHFADYYQPSAILLDVGLPGISGWTVMERLKANEKTRHIPVHFVSGQDDTLEGLKMGAVGFLTKPIDPGKLETAFQKIERILAKTVKTLLIVEDDTVQASSIQALIGNEDVETITVATAKEAFELLASEPVDCMILDLGLGDMSGFDLLEKIRTHLKHLTLPIIVYTGRDLSQKETAELQKYADSIIIKGVRSPERLLDETTLFLHRVASNLPEAGPPAPADFSEKDRILKDKKILIVDDDMRNVFALASVLEEKGAHIIEARNGLECLKMLEAHPDTRLILMDIMMPEMDGYEAIRRIREQPPHENISIIALTAKTMKGDRKKCIDAGANDYIGKPVDTERLLSLLRVWLY